MFTLVYNLLVVFPGHVIRHSPWSNELIFLQVWLNVARYINRLFAVVISGQKKENRIMMFPIIIRGLWKDYILVPRPWPGARCNMIWMIACARGVVVLVSPLWPQPCLAPLSWMEIFVFVFLIDHWENFASWSLPVLFFSHRSCEGTKERQRE